MKSIMNIQIVQTENFRKHIGESVIKIRDCDKLLGIKIDSKLFLKFI